MSDLDQVVLNLILNASDAIEETGRRGVIAVATAVEGDEAVVRISDDGCGFPDDVRANIFDPFFTTKEVDRGSGQGSTMGTSADTAPRPRGLEWTRPGRSM
jgi:C4-dicarboxylate-specific signal transduction histidine kinase